MSGGETGSAGATFHDEAENFFPLVIPTPKMIAMISQVENLSLGPAGGSLRRTGRYAHSAALLIQVGAPALSCGEPRQKDLSACAFLPGI